MRGINVLRLLPVTLLLTGCKVTINAADVLVRSGEDAELRAHLERKWLIYTAPVAGTPVRFLQDGRELGTAITDASGCATVRLPAEASSEGEPFVASARFAGREFESVGGVFGWSDSRTIVAVDIDDTISQTDYSTLILDPTDAVSEPVAGARATLSALAKDYHILYITARPRVWARKTRTWLREHDFPPGPLACGPDSLAVVAQLGFKERFVAELRGDWPNTLIGIGDRAPDCFGFGNNGMLTLLITDDESLDHGYAVRLTDWCAVEQYFERHHELLSRPLELADHLNYEGAPPPDSVVDRGPLAARP